MSILLLFILFIHFLYPNQVLYPIQICHPFILVYPHLAFFILVYPFQFYFLIFIYYPHLIILFYVCCHFSIKHLHICKSNVFFIVNCYFLSAVNLYYQTPEAPFIIHASILRFFNYFISAALIIHFYDHLYILMAHLLIQYMY